MTTNNLLAPHAVAIAVLGAFPSYGLPSLLRLSGQSGSLFSTAKRLLKITELLLPA